MLISLITAVSQNNVIGKNNALIWRLPEDMKRFKSHTMGHHIIMGRRCYESLGKPLPGRTNIVITRKNDYCPVGCLITHSIKEALNIAGENKETEAFIIGGEQIYRQSLVFVSRIYMTRIHWVFNGDAFFPELGNEWQEMSREDRMDGHPYPYSFITYEKT